MYCHNCGKEIEDDVKFCSHCGASQSTGRASSEPLEEFVEVSTDHFDEVRKETAVHSTPAATAPAAADQPPKVWTVFSKIGKILGIVCLSTSLIPYINYFSLSFAVIGIVMSCLGRKAKTVETDNNCRIGLKLSIAALVVSLVMAIVYYVIFIIAQAELWRIFNIVQAPFVLKGM